MWYGSGELATQSSLLALFTGGGRVRAAEAACICGVGRHRIESDVFDLLALEPTLLLTPPDAEKVRLRWEPTCFSRSFASRILIFALLMFPVLWWTLLTTIVCYYPCPMFAPLVPSRPTVPQRRAVPKPVHHAQLVGHRGSDSVLCQLPRRIFQLLRRSNITMGED